MDGSDSLRSFATHKVEWPPFLTSDVWVPNMGDLTTHVFLSWMVQIPSLSWDFTPRDFMSFYAKTSTFQLANPWDPIPWVIQQSISLEFYTRRMPPQPSRSSKRSNGFRDLVNSPQRTPTINLLLGDFCETDKVFSYGTCPPAKHLHCASFQCFKH